MQLELKPANKLTYKLRLTPQMRLAISLLQMPLVKLQEYVKQQIEENPLLEVANIEVPLKEVESDLNSDEDEEKQNYRENLITKSATLSDRLLNQLHLFVNSDEERKIGEVIIANIDDNGYLKSSIEEMAKSTQVTPQEVEKVLSLVQTFDPIGVGARDLRECLFLQINPIRNTKAINPVRNTEYTGRENKISNGVNGKDKISNGVKARGQGKFLPAGRQALVGQIIDRYLPYLEKKRFEFIAKKLKVPVERIKEAIKQIANLEPKPGRSFNTERAVRLIPDVILKRNNDKYEVVLNDWELPSLNLNPKYKKMLRQKDITENTKEYLKERLKAAKFLIDAINKRKETIQKVTEAIVYIQKDFFKGMQNLKPMTLSQIANLVDKHKSTVSRTVNNKYLQTPDGIFELRHFLNSGLKQENGELYSSKAIRAKIEELIENENKENPLTDQQVASHFKQEGISISRRVIAKYRNQLKILSSQSRRE